MLSAFKNIFKEKITFVFLSTAVLFSAVPVGVSLSSESFYLSEMMLL
jgi:hypothetical protein